MIAPASIVINDANYRQFLTAPPGQGMGLVPRDFAACPVGYLGRVAEPFPDSMLIPEADIQAMLDEQEAKKTSLQHIWMRGNNGGPIPPLDQNGRGYCWAHSSVSSAVAQRAKEGQPYVGLSAYHVACIIKGYADQGGWNAESIDFLAEKGVASEKFWPMKSTSRSNDTPEMWANAALHKITEWWDLSDDEDKVWHQLATCSCLNIPVATDYNWWSHSVMFSRMLQYKPRRSRILNSWGMWGDNGFGDLEGSRAVPNGAIAVRVSRFSDN